MYNVIFVDEVKSKFRSGMNLALEVSRIAVVVKVSVSAIATVVVK